MNEVKIFESEEFGSVRTVEEDGKMLFCGSDVAKALGYTRPNDAVNDHCRIDATSKRRTIIDRLGRKQEALFIPEGDVYRLIAHSKLPAADQFERWIFDDVIPTIRKTGGYVNNDELFINTYFSDVSDDVKMVLRTSLDSLRRKDEIIAAQRKEIEHKEDVIVGLVEDIDLATKRQRINQIIRFHAKDKGAMTTKWNLLYSEFEKKYHVNLSLRLTNYKDAYKPKLKNKLDVIDRQMNKIPQLYEVCCKLFESDVKVLMKEWENAIAC